MSYPRCEVPEHDGMGAEVVQLRDGLHQIAAARCLRNLAPPGCAGTCVTCQARTLLEENHDE